MSQQAREWVVSQLAFQRDSEKADLLDESLTNTDLIGALTIAARTFGGGAILVTSVRTDHGDDSHLGPHGHSEGFAVDVWPQGAGGPIFVGELIHNNPFVTKIGLGGAAQGWIEDAVWAGRDVIVINGTVIFRDNSTPHVHIQTD